MREEFLGVEFDVLTRDQVLDRLRSVTDRSPFGYVVTPNVDHIVTLEREDSSGLRGIVERAGLCLCDSRVLARLARLRGVRLPVVPGSDLTAALFEHVILPGDRIAIVGGDALMADVLRKRFPAIDLMHFDPPMGLRHNEEAQSATASFVVSASARFTFLAVGFPQQELVAARVAADPSARGMALCVGASLNFLTERQRRAPFFLRSLGLEWAYRLFSEPRRLWRRYLVEGPAIFRLAWHWRRA